MAPALRHMRAQHTERAEHRVHADMPAAARRQLVTPGEELRTWSYRCASSPGPWRVRPVGATPPLRRSACHALRPMSPVARPLRHLVLRRCRFSSLSSLSSAVCRRAAGCSRSPLLSCSRTQSCAFAQPLPLLSRPSSPASPRAALGVGFPLLLSCACASPLPLSPVLRRCVRSPPAAVSPPCGVPCLLALPPSCVACHPLGRFAAPSATACQPQLSRRLVGSAQLVVRWCRTAQIASPHRCSAVGSISTAWIASLALRPGR